MAGGRPTVARRLIATALGAAALAAGALACGRGAGGGGSDEVAARLTVAELLGGAAGGEGFAHALAPRAFSFPADHGPHPDFRNEWWYATGNLDTPEGRHFGFQLTFFRSALTPHPQARPSPWAASQVYLAHFALTDVAARELHAFDRFARGGELGLAGAVASPFRVWLEGWSMAGPSAEAAGIFPLRLSAAAGEVAIDLTLSAGKPPVLQGDAGLSRKGPEPGNASYYDSLTRLPAAGTVTAGGRRFTVSGLAWIDREWSTSALSRGQVGWDWFALQLDDGRELTFYRLRRRDGGTDPFSAGSLAGAGGETRRLGADDLRIEALGTWKSPASGVVYPSGWRLLLPAEGLNLRVEPWLDAQELDLAVRYWEGAVKVEGIEATGRPVAGNGYVELTGYGERP